MTGRGSYLGYLEYQLNCAVFGELTLPAPFDPWRRLHRLDGREVAMLTAHLAGASYEEIGLTWLISEYRVRNVVSKALAELRRPE